MVSASRAYIIHFIAYLSLQLFAPFTVRTYVSGISHQHRIRGLQDPTNNFVVLKILEGFRRGNNRVDLRSPITIIVLKKLVLATAHVCSSQFEAALFSAAFKLAFFAFLRIGEITAGTRADVPDRAIGVDDISFVFREGDNPSFQLKLKIRKSKNDQRGNSCTLFLERFPLC